MALGIGDQQAQSGMSKAIYDSLNTLMSPKIPPDQLPAVQKGWQELAFAVASGVVNHLLANLEIKNIAVSGTATLPVAGGNASGTVSLAQSGATTGHVG